MTQSSRVEIAALESRLFLSATFLPQAGWVVSDSTRSTGGDAAASAVDGNLNTRWSTDTNQANGQYFQVDLGSAQSFNTVSIDAGPNVADYAQGYAIYVSSTGTDWTAQTAVSTGVGNSPQIVSTFAAQTARYVRIVQTGSSTKWWWSIAELNIGTTPTAPQTTVVPAPAVTPTVTEQYALQLINRARANPNAEITRLAANTTWNGATPDLNEGLPAGTISSTAKQPVVFNPNLITAARLHSQWQINNNYALNHYEGAASPQDRDVAAGYVLGPNGQTGENITTGNVVAGDFKPAVDYSQAIDVSDQGAASRGHRTNMMNGLWNEIGIGENDGAWQGLPDVAILTEDYAFAGNGPFLTGVTFNDVNQDNFYEPGEQLGGVTITATRLSNNAVFSTQTWTSGGYNIPLTPGTYTVTASGGNILSPATQTVTIGTQNVEADFIATAAQPITPSAPVIVIQPQPVKVAIGSAAQFAISFISNPQASVQWQISTDGGNSYTAIAGATGQVYSFTPTAGQNGNLFEAVITNSQGSVTSAAASLALSGLPLTVIKPIAAGNILTVNAGDVVTLTAAATGSGVTQQWSVSTDGYQTYTPIAGATGTSYIVTATAAMNGYAYQIVFTDAIGATRPSVASLWVNAVPATPTITAQPQNAVATVGTMATVTAAVTDPTATVQWQVLTTPTTTAAAGIFTASIHQVTATSSHVSKTQVFMDISGGVGTTLSVPISKTGTTRYRAVITNPAGTVTSSVVTVTANTKAKVIDDLNTLRIAANAAISAINTCKRETAALVSKLTADFHRLKITKTHGQLLKELAFDERVSRLAFQAHEQSVLTALIRAASRVTTDALKLKKNPSSSAVTTQLQSDLNAMQAAAAASTAPADAQDCRFATADPLVAVSATVPTDVQLQNDVAAGQSSSENIGQALQAPMAIAVAYTSHLTGDTTP